MKHLILSTDSIFDSRTGKAFPGIIKQLMNFKSQNTQREIAVISARGSYLDQVPDILNPLKVPFRLRGSGDGLADFLSRRLNRKLDDIIILGAKDADMQTAKHLQAILLRADYAKHNNPTETIFTKDYGIPLKGVESIGHFFNSFNSVQNPWYYKLQVDEDTSFIALTSANTFSDADTHSVKIKTEFLEYLKNHKQEYVVPFASYFIVTAHLMMKELSIFDYWDIFPSSGKNSVNEDLLYFAKKASHTFGKRFQSERLFIRFTDSIPRHKQSASFRISNGCNEQFRTLIINPYYQDKLEGKNVCIIDDFTRHGTSCETVRYMLKKAKVNKILFIAMGKFGSSRGYNKYDYKLTGNVFTGLTYKQLNREMIYGDMNPKASKDFIESLGGLI